jgi:hypothetical protein
MLPIDQYWESPQASEIKDPPTCSVSKKFICLRMWRLNKKQLQRGDWRLVSQLPAVLTNYRKITKHAVTSTVYI